MPRASIDPANLPALKDESPWLNVRMEPEMKRELRRCAMEAECSMSELIVEMVECYLQGAREAREGL